MWKVSMSNPQQQDGDAKKTRGARTRGNRERSPHGFSQAFALRRSGLRDVCPAFLAVFVLIETKNPNVMMIFLGVHFNLLNCLPEALMLWVLPAALIQCSPKELRPLETDHQIQILPCYLLAV